MSSTFELCPTSHAPGSVKPASVAASLIFAPRSPPRTRPGARGAQRAASSYSVKRLAVATGRKGGSSRLPRLERVRELQGRLKPASHPCHQGPRKLLRG